MTLNPNILSLMPFEYKQIRISDIFLYLFEIITKMKNENLFLEKSKRRIS